AGVAGAARRLRIGPGLVRAAFSVEIDAPDEEEHYRQLRAVCRLARLSTVPLVSVPAAPAGTGLDAEVERLTKLVHVAEQEGILLTVDARLGTLTEDPETAAAPCEGVRGLGVTLDPGPYIAWPEHGEP